MLTVYHRPRERPEGAMVRGWSVNGDGTQSMDVIPSVFPSLTAAREAKPTGAHVLARQREDDPSIVETWI